MLRRIVARFSLLAVLVSTAACADESSVKKEMAAKFPDIPVHSVKKAPVKGLYEIVAGAQVFYVDEKVEHVILGNLIENAAKWCRRRVRISAGPSVPGQMVVVVEDDGPGIPAALREQIFDPFITTRSNGEGTGLGLYLVEEIVSEHQGCIVLDAPSGGGTRFSIWLPGPRSPAT